MKSPPSSATQALASSPWPMMDPQLATAASSSLPLCAFTPLSIFALPLEQTLTRRAACLPANPVVQAPCPSLDGKHTIFGRVKSGMLSVKRLAQAETDDRDKPQADVRIVSATPDERALLI